MLTNNSAKRILIYGDSYVFGKVPGGQRYNAEDRYTGIVQKILGNEYEIIEEGLRGRMLTGENKFFPFRNGLEQFGPIVGSHLPLNLVIIALGTNDTNSGDQLTDDTVLALPKYMEAVNWWSQHLGFTLPQIMFVIPPMVDEKAAATVFGDIFKGAEIKMAKLQKLMTQFCQKSNIPYINLAPTINVSSVDGVHLDIANNNKIAQSISEKIYTLL